MLGAEMLDRDVLVVGILRELTARIQRWQSKQERDTQLVEDYRRHSLTLGSRVRAILPGDREIIGIATEIDGTGRLLIDTDTELVTVSAGDITHLRPAE